jgi:hypothetical protein
MTGMTEWTPPPPAGPAAVGGDVAVFLVVSGPGGLTSRWEGPEPGPALRSIVAEEASSLGGRVPPEGDQAAGCTFLRLTLRPFPPDEDLTANTSFSVGFEAGPGGAPSDHPRLPLHVLLEHAASNANR